MTGPPSLFLSRFMSSRIFWIFRCVPPGKKGDAPQVNAGPGGAAALGIENP